jgi:hypothetical protein
VTLGAGSLTDGGKIVVLVRKLPLVSPGAKFYWLTTM